MKIIITDIGENDAYYEDRNRVIGLVGELNEPISRRQDLVWDRHREPGNGWHVVYMKPNPLSCLLLGFPWSLTNPGEVCFLEAKYKIAKGD